MTLDVSLEGIAALAGFFVLVWELRRGVRQMRFQAVLEIYKTNRELIQLALDDPDLMAVLEGREEVDSTKERRYLQMWLNQMTMVYLGWRNRFLPRSSWEGLRRDIQESSQSPNVRKLWNQLSPYYDEEFQKFMTEMIDKSD
ncbi:DUF6082 family protein [Cerasicoccus arenae]|uniref:DUF4760 domain-containing protein n=1 Tax=Cerasicoccus arenae TaxID=424488 RepID=A0A8J3GFI7_9BACT|nr:DUF6082 family protein [Cerasicoccus arenae]MBK1857782.1 hypothetical protein [Cerasicoccus arenae]GHC12029.1 hypothetical protein GCM10007047_31780 [Cerasicoccus arenae]